MHIPLVYIRCLLSLYHLPRDSASLQETWNHAESTRRYTNSTYVCHDCFSCFSSSPKALYRLAALDQDQSANIGETKKSIMHIVLRLEGTRNWSQPSIIVSAWQIRTEACSILLVPRWPNGKIIWKSRMAASGLPFSFIFREHRSRKPIITGFDNFGRGRV